jgi:hypothetical protein
MRTYTELKGIKSFEERYKYLKLGGRVGEETFGFDRYLNQLFYRSKEWKHVRDIVIIRDNGCDLGVDGYDIPKFAYVHHMNPVSIKEIQNGGKNLLDPEYLITVSRGTHNAIHYGDESYILNMEIIERKPNDTCPWKR